MLKQVQHDRVELIAHPMVTLFIVNETISGLVFKYLS